jgi:hypothetical protein
LQWWPAVGVGALEIDAEVRGRPGMAMAELQRLLQERDELLPLVSDPPPVPSGPPAPSRPEAWGSSGDPARDPQSRWAAVDPAGIDGAVQVAMGTIIAPMTSAPPPVPPSVLFPELAAVGTEATVAAAGTETAVAVAGTETAVAVAGGSSVIPVVG